MPCCIPGCSNLLSERTTELPHDATLLARWKAAIQAGTGQYLSDEGVHFGAQVCDMHFEDTSSEPLLEIKNLYREPSIFVRHDMVLRVASCRLCGCYGTIDTMFDEEYCLDQENSLLWMIGKYFGLKLQPSKEHSQEGYFCERCVVRIDMTHSFWREIADALGEYKKFLRKTEKETTVFRSVDPLQVQVELDVLKMYNSEHENRQKEEVVSSSDSEEFSDTEYDNGLEQDADDSTADPENIAYKAISLNDHRTKNDTIKPFKCSRCPMKFVRKYTQTRHEVRKHGINNGQTTEATKSSEQTNTNTCSSCGKAYDANKENDGYEVEQNCEECSENSDRQTSANTNPSSPETVKPFKCSVCPVTFVRKYTQIRHEMKQHGMHGDTGKRTLPQEKTDGTKKHKKVNPEMEEETVSQEVTAKHDSTKNGKPIEQAVGCSDSEDTSDTELDNEFEHDANYISAAPDKEPAHLIDGDPQQSYPGPISGDRYKCYMCDTALESKKSLIHHLMIDHKSQEWYSCWKCDASFQKATLLNNHLASHEVYKPFRCKLCPMTFVRKYTQIRHEIRQHGIEHGEPGELTTTHICSSCGKAYANKQGLIGLEMNSYSCDECSSDNVSSKTTNSSAQDAVKPFKCSFCPVTFVRKYTQIRHEVKQHGMVHGDSSNKLNKTNNCLSCGETFGNKMELTRHESVHHPRKAKINCEICNKSLASLRNLEEHLKTHLN